MAGPRRYVILGDLHLGAPRAGGGGGGGASALAQLLGDDGGDFDLVVLGGLFDVSDAILGVAGGPRTFTEADSLARVRALTRLHHDVLGALGAFLAAGRRVTWMPGDGDADLLWPECRDAVANALGAEGGRFRFHLRRNLRLPGGVWVEHGSGRLPADALPDLDDPIAEGEVRAAPSTLAALGRWGGDPDGWARVRDVRPRSVALGDATDDDVADALDRAAAALRRERAGLTAVVFGHHPAPREDGDGRGWWCPGPWDAAGRRIEVVVDGAAVDVRLVARDVPREALALSVLIATAGDRPETGALRDLLSAAGAAVDVLSGTTYDALVDVLAGGRHTAVHLAVPSRVRNGRFELLLARADCADPDPLRADDLGDLLLGTGVRALVVHAAGVDRPFLAETAARAALGAAEAGGAPLWREVAATGVLGELRFPGLTAVAEAASPEAAGAEEIDAAGGPDDAAGSDEDAGRPAAPSPAPADDVRAAPITAAALAASPDHGGALERIRAEVVAPRDLVERVVAWVRAGRDVVITGPERSGRRTLAEAVNRALGTPGRARRGDLAWGRAVAAGPMACGDPGHEARVARAKALAAAGCASPPDGFDGAAQIVLGFVSVARESGASVPTGRVVDALSYVACACAQEAPSPIEAADEAIAVDLAPCLDASEVGEKELGQARKWASVAAKGTSRAAPPPPKALERTADRLQSYIDLRAAR